ncbi:type VI secretion system contractile sheath large subunit [Sansalvadorimonas sp. 2012CJ34-2]|uniref:Type VI secretion system contractile sheath large subunit n=1 Tax=Parendozoicomonas callyspongiae TaxID=2942213 RepID=A0ABT0PJA7_9GAMM|nr:type VI secretion system contractile sheath large subunit [Sansalvadorimonas sp. 2012CJ34-2]MCL6271443.1 type VI secretion system contractile sheath large subunit [Sansalvadorimonas sp. 2012CJ34-2]
MLSRLLSQALEIIEDGSNLAEDAGDDWLEFVMQGLIAEIDERISRQLEPVIQDNHFKKLEALWRNLRALAGEGYPAGQVRIRILDMTWSQLSDDLNLSFTLKDSSLYRRIYQQEFSTSGGHPFGLLLVDHAVTTDLDPDTGHDDLYTMQLLGQLGHESLCPVLLPVADHFIGTDDPDVWTDPERVGRIFASDDFTGWRQLRSEKVSQFIGLTMPAIRIREPWANYQNQFLFDEQSAFAADSSTLWGNSAFALARNVLREFCRISWFGFLRSGTDARSGGALVDLYSEPVISMRITPALDNFYSENGFVPLANGYLDNKIGIFSNRSVFQPEGAGAGAGVGESSSDAAVISMLQTTLLACRIGHYLKAQIRDKIGSYKSASECERELNAWLQTYTSNVEHAEEHILARYPLKKSMVKVEGDSGTGRFHCQVSMQPQYQFDFLTSSIVLRTELGRNSQAGRAG